MGGNLRTDTNTGCAEALSTEPIGEAGDEHAIHADGEKKLVASPQTGDGEGDGFVFSEAIEIAVGEGDIERLAGGAGGADPFGDSGIRN